MMKYVFWGVTRWWIPSMLTVQIRWRGDLANEGLNGLILLFRYPVHECFWSEISYPTP